MEHEESGVRRHKQREVEVRREVGFLGVGVSGEIVGGEEMGRGFCLSLIRALEAPGLKTQPLLTCVLLLWQHLPHSFHFSALSSSLTSKVLHLPPSPQLFHLIIFAFHLLL